MLSDRQLAEAALDSGWVSLEDLQRIVPAARQRQIPLPAALKRFGLSSEQVAYLLAATLGLPYTRPDRLTVTRHAREALPREMQHRYRILSLRSEPGLNGVTVYAAVLPETAQELAAKVSAKLDVALRPVAASTEAIAAALRAFDVTLHADDTHFAAADVDLDTPAIARRGTAALAYFEAPPGASGNNARNLGRTLHDF